MRLLANLVLLLATQTAVAADIDFVSIATERDCGVEESPAGPAVCRVRESEDADRITDMVQAGRNLTRAGDSLLFVYRGDAQRVSLGGGLQFPLSRLSGTDLWALRLRIRELDRLILSYEFLVDGARPTVSNAMQWRAPEAPPRWVPTGELRGTLSDLVIESRYLGSSRTVTLYESPHMSGQSPVAVVYAADGQNLHRFVSLIDPLIASRELPPMLVVGMHSAHGMQRAREYVPKMGSKSGAFVAHERFLLDEVIPHVERRYSLQPGGAMRILFGYSNGADWALATALRNPSAVNKVIAFSASWPIPEGEFRKAAESGMAVAVGSGSLEGEFHENTLRVASALEAAGVPNLHQQAVAGHDLALWQQLLPAALRWCLRAENAPSGTEAEVRNQIASGKHQGTQ